MEGGEIRDEQTGSIHGYCRIWTDTWITSPLSLRFAIIPASHKAQQVDDMKVLCEHRSTIQMITTVINAIIEDHINNFAIHY